MSMSRRCVSRRRGKPVDDLRLYHHHQPSTVADLSRRMGSALSAPVKAARAAPFSAEPFSVGDSTRRSGRDRRRLRLRKLTKMTISSRALRRRCGDQEAEGDELRDAMGRAAREDGAPLHGELAAD